MMRENKMNRLWKACFLWLLITGGRKKKSYTSPGDFAGDWGDTKLTQLEDYLIQDTRTEEGRLFVSDHLGFKDSWMETCHEYSATTPLTKKI